MDIKELQKKVYEEYKRNGFEEKFNPHGKIGDLAELGLIHTEISELQESIRDGKVDGLELADVLIRVLNFASRQEIDIERCLEEKIKLNEERGYHHGRKVI